VFLVENRHLLGDESAYRGVVALGKTLLINMAITGGGASFSQVDHWGHAGGLVGGAVWGALVGPRLSVVRLPPRQQLSQSSSGKPLALVDRPRLPTACGNLLNWVRQHAPLPGREARARGRVVDYYY
jgi:hypothetical protein